MISWVFLFVCYDFYVYKAALILSIEMHCICRNVFLIKTQGMLQDGQAYSQTL